ncbi:MAG: 3' terminal RNA ribose 2'-O-methyltransferase Hen1 [Deltaproteobacteria bacterium]|nr:3' terminal RNA ribose 2'-O-methyltransferase Hen1 [Deltaproteobacteria bacterium]
MLLTISTTHSPATDLGFLLHKNPAKVQSFSLPVGHAHVFYPRADAEQCTFAMMIEVDPVALVRGSGGERSDFSLRQYVNDRPYAASSFFSVALSKVLSSALAGKSSTHDELSNSPIPLEATISVLPCRGGEKLLHELFAPLGYEISAVRHTLDDTFPDWGESSYFTVSLRHCIPLKDLLTHLYVLVPVLDNDKHYWVGSDEVDKLLRRGAGWLDTHPAREMITLRYLKHQRSLVRFALSRLIPEEEDIEDEESESLAEEKVPTLHEERISAVFDLLKASGASRVLDLGCGEGRLLKLLLKDKQFEEIVGVDVSIRALEIASSRLHFEKLPDKVRKRITLRHGSLLYCDRKLEGFDAAAVVEVIEHLDPPRLNSFERTVFEFAKPKLVVITTPNVEYNVKFENLAVGNFRHGDHRFEWSRAEFLAWGTAVAERYGYALEVLPLGPEDEVVGAPSQMGVFRR